MKKLLLATFISAFIFTLVVGFVRAQNVNCDDVNNLSVEQLGTCIDQLNQAKSQSEKATKPLEDQVAAIQARVNFIESDLVVKEKNINDGYKNLEKQQKILNETIRDYYIKSYYNSPLVILLTAHSASDLTQVLGYQKATADRDKALITSIVLSITGLEERKKALEIEKANIVVVKDKLASVVSEAKAYQAKLSSQISSLSARQQQILSQRLASLNIPLYANTAGGCSSDLTNGKDPGFSGGYGLFTYGVPNRVGLNQYGAKGRADAGKSYDDILHAYYNFDSNYGSVDENTTIKVNDGNGINQGNVIWTGTLNQYLKRIYEVPGSWPSEALKAQVIAVRSYVMAQTNNGANSICSNTHCQVFQDNEKGGAWNQAVDDTSGKVMTNGGQTIVAYFSSTHGGYIHSSGGDISSRPWLKDGKDTSTDSINSFSDLKNNAYDKDSPWFYCDWGSRSSNGGTAWLKSNELADIVNVLMLVQKDGGTKEHLYQVDKSNPAGTDTWDADRVKQELKSRGGSPIDNVNSASVSVDFGSGNTTSVNINGMSFSGSDFKTYFNLRAPANIQIVGPLYNIEQH